MIFFYGIFLDYVCGGEMFTHLSNRERFTEDEVRFFIAEIVIAIEQLHRLEILYRDIKLGNSHFFRLEFFRKGKSAYQNLSCHFRKYPTGCGWPCGHNGFWNVQTAGQSIEWPIVQLLRHHGICKCL